MSAEPRFADVEPALTDSTRLRWLLPIIDGEDDAVANARTAALSAGMLRGLSGIPLVDFAIAACPQ